MKEELIIHEYNYSDIIAVKEGVDYLIQYIDDCYKQYLDLVAEDKRKNQNLALEYRNYDYWNSIDNFTINITSKQNQYIVCKNYEQYLKIFKEGRIQNVKEIIINLKLSYQRGQYKNIITCNHSFNISFKPYDIRFKRQSNYNDELMDKIEEMIRSIFSKFSVIDTIFYSK